jgi:hypothetical protein
MSIKKIFKRILLFSCIILVLAYSLYFTVLEPFYLQVFPFLILFFIFSTLAIHAVLLKTGSGRPARFSAFFMGSITLKLFLYSIFMIIYILADRENAVVFLITFFILYLFYTVFETYTLLKDFNQLTKS